jgi:hypothetical protein
VREHKEREKQNGTCLTQRHRELKGSRSFAELCALGDFAFFEDWFEAMALVGKAS